MKNRFLLLMTLFAVAFSCSEPQPKSACVDPIDLVDPYIGTDWHGHVFLGASVPFGMVQIGPTNITSGWDWCSGYHYSDSTLVGFSHTHLSGTGCADLGDLYILPVSGDYPLALGTAEDIASGYMTTYCHENEVVSPNYYAVTDDKYSIKSEVTATERAAIQRYTYPNGADNNTIIIDLESYILGQERDLRGLIEVVGNNAIKGHRHSRGWAPEQKFFYYTEFSEPIESIQIYNGDKKVEGDVVMGEALRAYIKFADKEGARTIQVKSGISAVSADGAEANLKAEIPSWDFDQVAASARDAWNGFLSKIDVKSDNKDDVTVFYTSMYHTAIHPSLFSDVDGSYRGPDDQVHNSKEHDTYTIFSLWDTYRALHPLMTILEPERTSDFVSSMLNIADQQGRLPIWHLWGFETDCMVGVHSIPPIVDAYLKGIEGIDAERALKTLKAYAERDEYGLKAVRENKVIKATDVRGSSVARALEYAIDDWGIAQMAKEMGDMEAYELFKERSQYYKLYYDKETGFMRGMNADGSWTTPFDPVQAGHGNNYCEGNAWQYLWLVPQDVEGLVECMGSTEKFISRLDRLFVLDSDLGEGAAADVTGMIGQYAQGNEPNHSTPFLYTYVGEQWKTAALTREIMDTYYTDKKDGVCGNEDCGQMSAWYVFTAMGFYPVNPMNSAYVLASPLFDEAEVKLDNGNSFKVVAENNSEENIYIQSATLNGAPYTKAYITHSDIMSGGNLTFVMGSTPNKEFGAGDENVAKSILYK